MKNPISVFQFLPATVLLFCAGCYSGTPDRVNPPDVDPSGAAKKAMDQYDTNNDGQLSAEELVACPAILKDLEFFDANSDGNVSDDEIKARIQSWHDSRTGIMSTDGRGGGCAPTTDNKDVCFVTVRPQVVFSYRWT